MKIPAILFISLLSTVAIARELVSPASTVRGYQYQACGSWAFSNPQSGFPGYICAANPQYVYVAEAGSVKTTVQALEDQIAKLEERIKALEAKIP